MRPVVPPSAASHNVDYNAISVKTDEEIAMMRTAGQISARVLEQLNPHVQPGVSSQAINDLAHRLIVDKYHRKSTARISPVTTRASSPVFPSHTTTSLSVASPARCRCRQATCSAWT
jgi:methionine aminopeptidase